MKLTNGQVQSKKREAASLLRLETAAEGVGTTVFFVVGYKPHSDYFIINSAR